MQFLTFDYGFGSLQTVNFKQKEFCRSSFSVPQGSTIDVRIILAMRTLTRKLIFPYNF